MILLLLYEAQLLSSYLSVYVDMFVSVCVGTSNCFIVEEVIEVDELEEANISATARK